MTTREFGCTECDFMIRSEDEDELIKLVQQHATDVHGMAIDRNDIRGNWKTV